MPAGLARGLASEMIVYPGATEVRSLVKPGVDRISYRLETPYPARNVINLVASRLASSGWKPLRNNWFNRDDASEFLRGWVQYTAVNKPGGRERFLCRWWAQWTNEKGDLVDYSFQYLSPGETFTNNSKVEVQGSKMSAETARRLLHPGAAEKQVIELPVGTPPNAETANDNSPDPHVFQTRPAGG
jgi:hypothetical protein